jgi:uncharacterized protein (TIGR02246 family)
MVRPKGRGKASEAAARRADKAVIRASSARFSKAAHAKHLDKTVSFYATDGLLFVNGGPLVKGSVAIRAIWRKFLATAGADVSFRTSAIKVARAGVLAYEYGTYKAAMGNAPTDRGKYVVIWRKEPDGSWRVVVDINNSGH